MLSRSGGFGLIEALVSIIVLSLGLSTLMVLYFASTAQQAKPIQILQANYLAQNYLDQVMLSSSWQTCQSNKTLALCQYIHSDKPLPIESEDKAFRRFKMKITVSPDQEVALIKMKKVDVSIYWQQDELVSMNAWVASL